MQPTGRPFCISGPPSGNFLPFQTQYSSEVDHATLRLARRERLDGPARSGQDDAALVEAVRARRRRGIRPALRGAPRAALPLRAPDVRGRAADDVVQETFMVLLRGERFHPRRGTLSGYLFGIARHHILKRISSAQRESAIEAAHNRRPPKWRRHSFRSATAGMPVSNAQLVRLEVPRAALASFGLTPMDVPDGGSPGTASGTVQADVLVGEDGVARAVRFVGRASAGAVPAAGGLRDYRRAAASAACTAKAGIVAVQSSEFRVQIDFGLGRI